MIYLNYNYLTEETFLPINLSSYITVIIYSYCADSFLVSIFVVLTVENILQYSA